MGIREKIIDYLERNRVSTTEVADALDKTGVLPGLMPINKGHYRAGKIKWIYAYDESNWSVHKQIQNIEENCVVYVEAFNCNDRAVFGELVSKYLLLYCRSKALIVSGKMRDAAGLIKENWPIWCSGYNPVGCFNKAPENEFEPMIIEDRHIKYDGAIAVCDDCGVVVIPNEKITENFLNRLHQMEDQEDVWFDRLDHYKENTFEIVCQKKYLDDDVYMSRRKIN